MRTLQEIQPGQTLGRYEFLVPIAEGGMASVWAARLKGSRGFSKTVAVKTMLPSVSDDQQFEQMFLDEAQIASRIRHPNVVEILDLGEQDEVLYLVMEWVDGEPLSNLRRAAAKHGGIPRNIAVRAISGACAGLHAAHELKDESGQLVGLVHRDISPQNILVTFDGVVKIVDFGVAKAAGRSTGETTAGQVKGKPPYMSPEQALGEPVDRRTDVFALGIILYQLTTGKHPFRGESDLVTLQNIVSDRPIVPPRAHDKQYPRALDALVMKALDRKREARFQTCAEMESAIDEVFSSELPRARTEDVSKFMREMLGSRGEARRKALADSIRSADERAAGRASFTELSLAARGEESKSSLTPVSGSLSLATAVREDLITDTSDVQVAKVTPFGATIPAPRSQARPRPLVIGMIAAGALLVGGILLLRPAPKPEAIEPTTQVVANPPVSATPVTVEAPPGVATEATETPPVVPASASAEPDVERPPGHDAPEGRPAVHRIAHPRAHVASHPSQPVSDTAHASSAKPSLQQQAQQKQKPPKNGFVPPPVTDPGF